MTQLFLVCLIYPSVFSICFANNHYMINRDHDLNVRDIYDLKKSTQLGDRNGRRRITTYSMEDGLNSFFNLGTKAIPATAAVIPDKLKKRVQRTTRKQYEIINMLWKKTRILNDDENHNQTMVKLPSENIILSTTSILPPTKSSSIEFYYNNEDINSEKQNDCKDNECGRLKKLNTLENNNSFLIFHLKAPYAIPQLAKLKLSHDTKTKADGETLVKESHEMFSKKTIINTVTMAETPLNNCNQNSIPTHKVLHTVPDPTTIYDKIKFFELYDHFTQKYNESNYCQSKKINKNEEKVKLEHVDHHSHGHDQAKLSKKHIRENPQNRIRRKGKTIKAKNTFVVNNVATIKQAENKRNIVNLTKSNIDISLLSYMNGNVSWLEYPFAAVYINERSHVYCDAAAISPHWLIASGACLSRVSKKPLSGSQSPYVAYCGEQWWRPERRAYVKYMHVHPSYNPTDKAKKHLNNIGVIQVVTSMLSACGGWAPVSMISHQSAANPTGIEATAVGWGLDRFGRRYDAAALPKIPLTIYKGIVYFGSCPGNVGYSQALRIGDEKGVKYIHCLSLPPYTSESNDPVHGGLLLIGGKLIALYLQEERRPWGHQSAQYTGIWPLLPWVMQVTKENQADSFIFEV